MSIKNRSTLYAVIRVAAVQHHQTWIRPVLVGATYSIRKAEEIRDNYQQELKDAGFDEYKFEVQPVTFYTE